VAIVDRFGKKKSEAVMPMKEKRKARMDRYDRARMILGRG
jgi:hypothetical protein